MSPQPPHLVYIVTDAIAAARSFAGQFKYMEQIGYKVTVIGSPGPALDRVAAQDGVTVIPVQMEREISPLKDLQSLSKLYSVLKQLQPDVVHTATPKASLLGMLCCWWLNTPLRYYGQWGLRLETTTGLKRQLLWWTERITAACAHHVLAVGEGLKKRFVAENLAPASKVRVVGKGSANGVDLIRFSQSTSNLQKAAQLRQQYSIPAHAKVIGFVGRLTKDKGIRELVHAFTDLYLQHPETHLLLVGDFEIGDPVDEEIKKLISEHPAIHVTGFITDTSPYYSLIDIFAFPSYREGLPNVLLEAAAAGLPIVASNCTGNEDILEHHHTGLSVDVGSSKQLQHALELFLTKPVIAKSCGRNALKLVEQFYEHHVFWQMLAEDYALTASQLKQPLLCPKPVSQSQRKAA